MLSIQHVYSLLLHDSNANSRLIAAAVYPDAIRAYTGPRQYSHFEESADGRDVSYMRFPDMKTDENGVKEYVQQYAHLTENIRSCAIGENTSYESFLIHNEHLDEEMQRGISIHLKQDILFDSFIRENIGCSKRYEDLFSFNGQQLSGKEVRFLIGKIEQQGIYVLSYLLFQKYGITTDQEWLCQNIKAVLNQEYPADLAEKTFSYMKIDPKVNEWITANDWSHISCGDLTLEQYRDLYDAVEDCINELRRKI